MHPPASFISLLGGEITLLAELDSVKINVSANLR